MPQVVVCVLEELKMVDIKECEYEGCSNTFDIDNNEGVIVTEMQEKTVVIHYYCCYAHRD